MITKFKIFEYSKEDDYTYTTVAESPFILG
jgi:hypothetical protein